MTQRNDKNLLTFNATSRNVQERNCIPFSFLSLLLIYRSSCSFINLNKYIDIFPPTDFVRVHTDKLLSENLGPSKFPLTILAYNNKNRIDARRRNSSIPWCKFFPVWRSFIGSRTQNTLNLISRNITKCFTCGSTNGRSSPIDTCIFMNVVHGRIRDDRRLFRSCEVSGDRKYTLIIADRREYSLFRMRPSYFLKNTREEAYPNFVLIFDSNIQNYFTRLCVLN
jgi:hypothetical protein